MKLLISLLFLTTTYCFSQEKITVQNTSESPLSDVSVFKISESNVLAGITDSLGTIKLALNDNQKYLFHLLGYIDRAVTAGELRNSPIVKLENAVYQLNTVGVRNQKLQFFKIRNKPGNWAVAEANTVKTTFERVTAIKIDKSGFLSKFSLYAHQNFAGEVRIFRFIMLNDDNGKPGSSIINTSVIGSLNAGKMIFKLDSLGTFIEKGTYYIGYETQNSGRPNAVFKELNTKNGVFLNYPMVFIRGKYVNTPKAFVRTNLKNWQSTHAPGDKKFIDYAYELEMRIPIAN